MDGEINPRQRQKRAIEQCQSYFLLEEPCLPNTQQAHCIEGDIARDVGH